MGMRAFCWRQLGPGRDVRVGKPPPARRPTVERSAVRALAWCSPVHDADVVREARQEKPMSLDLEALETSFDLVAPRGDELMDIFYAQLFAAAPAVKPLFARSDLKQQKAMLLGTLVLLRKSLRNLEAIVPKLHELGARHVSYGALPEHYPVVGQV